MKQGKAIIARAARIRAAVTAAVTGQGCPCLGARIEELLGEEIGQYPDQIMSLDTLPSVDGFEFIGYDVEFAQVLCVQNEFAPGKFIIGSDSPMVGWKPLRMGDTALTGRIDPRDVVSQAVKVRAADMASAFISNHGFSDNKTGYEDAEPYKGVPFCRGSHKSPWCKDPFCYLRR